jgi:cytochrome c biogenesis protein CcdA
MIGGEVLRLTGAVVSVVGLGIVMRLSPTLIALTLRVLTDATRAYRAVAFMLLGLTIGTTLILLILQVIDPHTFEAAISGDLRQLLVRRGIDLLAGAIFIIAAIVMGLRARRPPREKKPHRRLSGTPWEMTLLGLTNTLMGFSGFATMYAVARVIRAASGDDALKALTYVIFVAAMVAPYVLLAWAWRRLPSESAAVKRFFSRIAEVDVRPWATALTLVLGLAFVAMAI